MVVFVVLRIATPILDPETRKPVGENLQEIRKAFQNVDTLDAVQTWLHTHHNASSCVLLFETVTP